VTGEKRRRFEVSNDHGQLLAVVLEMESGWIVVDLHAPKPTSFSIDPDPEEGRAVIEGLLTFFASPRGRFVIETPFSLLTREEAAIERERFVAPERRLPGVAT